MHYETTYTSFYSCSLSLSSGVRTQSIVSVSLDEGRVGEGQKVGLARSKKQGIRFIIRLKKEK